MIRDVVTRGYSGQHDGLKFVVTAGYSIGPAAQITIEPGAPTWTEPTRGINWQEETRGITWQEPTRGLVWPTQV